MGSTTFPVLKFTKLEFQIVLEFRKLEFLVSIPLWHWLTWHLGIKKCHLLLEFPGLKYYISVVPSPLNSSINLYDFALHSKKLGPHIHIDT